MAETINEVKISAVQEVLQEQSTDLTLNTCLPDELSQDQKNTFMTLLTCYSDILASNGVTNVLSHHIKTESAQLIRQHARRVPLPCMGKVQELHNEMLHKKVNSPSQSHGHPLSYL